MDLIFKAVDVALASAGAAVDTAVFAMRRRAPNTYEALREDPDAVLANAGRVMGAVVIGAAVAGSANAEYLSYDETQSLSCLEMKGFGLSNTCPIIADSSDNKLNLKAGKPAGFSGSSELFRLQ